MPGLEPAKITGITITRTYCQKGKTCYMMTKSLRHPVLKSIRGKRLILYSVLKDEGIVARVNKTEL